ncbi:LOW QUALITY PROTEIN: acetylserotonin O-methyltransferase 1-like [Oryza sativa Japonica Group]|uniref:LOW QUALITY PROTEIN: acetylserotonin O-methyltransferase 1-like n=1 Tax=Oryza sativa subsp. japonica TaxID=39947 RepID=UPI00339CB35C
MSCTEQELSTQDMLQGHIDLHHHLYGYHKSMALLCATDLGIPGAIHRRGGAATISDIVADTMIPPAKLPHLRRLMRVLSVSGIFAVEEDVYKLTPASRILVGDKASCNFSPLVHLVVSPAMLTTFSSLSPWFRDGRNASPTALFEMAHGMPPWEMMKRDDTMNSALNDACVADSSFLMEIALRERGDVVFRGLRSLVDVGGGHGGAAMAIAKAFPDIKCSVLDLPHVISQAPDDGTVCFIAGDMFEDIPPADAVLLKHVLHCWDADDCVKIVGQCKKAIPVRGDGGKVILINPVIGYGVKQDSTLKRQVLADMNMIAIGGAEREEHEFKKIFLDAGFSDYRIMPVLGLMSIIEVYP